MEVTKCDRCLKEIEDGKRKSVSFESCWRYKEKFDLCKSCHKELVLKIKLWLKEVGRNGKGK